MHGIILSSVDCQALPCFSTQSDKRHDFRKKIIEYKTYVLVSSTTLKHLPFLEEVSEMLSLMYMRINLKKPLFFSDIILHENPSGRAELFQVDGGRERQTNRHDEASSHFWQFCERA